MSEYDVRPDDPPKPLTVELIEWWVDFFAGCAVRVQKASYDGLEINADADHLFHSFISRYWNRRDDEYGPQSMENRMRFVVNVIKSTTLYNLLRFILRFFGPAFLNWVSKIRLPAGWNPFKTIGKRVVIIGGAIHGCQLGEFMAKRGRQVTIVEPDEDNVGGLLAPEYKNRLFIWFKKKGVVMYSGAKLVEMKLPAASYGELSS